MKHAAWKKTAVLIVALVMALSTAACSVASTTPIPAQTGSAQTSSAQTGSATPAASTAAATPAPTPADITAKYDPPIEITGVRSVDSTMKFANGEAIDNNVWTKEYLKALGIQLKYLWVSDDSGYSAKLNIAIASNDLPDIIPAGMAQLSMLAQNDCIMPLDDLCNQWANTGLKKVLSADGGVQMDSARFGGKLMAIPSTASVLDQTQLLWIRKDWLTKLKLSAPKTMDDVLNIAKAFTTQDPDGDNKNDTFGLAVNKDLWGGVSSLCGFFYGYHAYPTVWVQKEDGNIVYGSIQPEIRTALSKLQDMFKAGEIDQEFGVKNTDKVAESITSSKIGMEYGQMWNPIVPLQDSLNNDKTADWEPYLLPSMDGTPAKSVASLPSSMYYCVNKNCKHPEAVFKLLNHDYDPGMSDRMDLQTNSQGWEIWKYEFIGCADPNQNLNQYKEIMNDLGQSGTPKFSNTSVQQIYESIQKYNKGDISGWSYTKVFGKESAYTLLDEVNNDKLIQMDAFYGPITDTMSDKKSTLDKMEMETFTKIIMGGDIGGFDQFVSQWKSLGGDQTTKEVNDWYVAKNKK